MITLKNQLIFNNFDELTNESTSKLFHLFNSHIDINEFIPLSFKESCYPALGSPREYSLPSMITFFIFKNILGFLE
ncbi:hypothetical protein GCM10008904_21360 [Paraclostridium ghonii]|uniref:Transposase n=1 Tax=Paraclostridium ghonii TaxID=29358 RepID=A0ABU0N032_9FIRM|nr:hypothetical protein [Paeniclostridium ghonii]MDQ0556528.1 hypothetical protein [Paeniclostridium ghonii]